MNEVIVDKGRRILILDNAFGLHFRHEMYKFARKSAFKIGWEDGGAIENAQHKFLHARYDHTEITDTRFMFQLARTPLLSELAGYDLTGAVMNLTTPTDVLMTHTHPEDKVLLYYVNLDWQNSWYGETLFFDESLTKIDLAAPYTPGRLILFDGKIPHTIRPQSQLAPAYRFTLSLLFERSSPGE